MLVISWVAIAYLRLAGNTAGFGIGPALADLISDFLMPRQGAASLNHGLLTINFCWFWAVPHFWIALKLTQKNSGERAYAVHP